MWSRQGMFGSVSLGSCAFTGCEARRMVRSIKGYKLFQGFRGRPKADLEMLEKLMVCMSEMAMNHPEIKEMDINPLLLHAEGDWATVADCRMILD